MNDLSLMSWNVKGLNNTVKRRKILSFIKSKKCNIVFIQETHLSSKAVVSNHRAADRGSTKSKRVTTLINKRLQIQCIKQSKDEAGRMLLMLCDKQGNKVILVNVYVPNVDDPSFFGLLENKLLEMGDHPIIMGGDFNEVMDPILDRSSRLSRTSKAVTVLRGMSEACSLVDIWRLQNPSRRDYTFYSPPHGSFSRIDFFLVSQSLVPAVASSLAT
uniref:exodeoxyribonuclease III n=1 Tax=Oryzias latipes TaxID=8090 RepID=A0A3P9LTX5_ORYLA